MSQILWIVVFQILVNADWNVEYIDKKYTLHWKILNESHCNQYSLNSCVEIALEVVTNGWFGFGISKTGQMTDSDMIIGWIDENNKPHLQSRYTTTTRTTPIFVKDITHSIISYEKISNVTKMNFVRELSPCQSHDYVQAIATGTTRVIYAWSDIMPNCSELQECELTSHGINRGKQFVNFFTKQQELEMPSDTKYFDLINTDYEVPPVDTTYYCKFLKFNLSNIETLRHIIRIDPVITPGNKGYFHHIIVTRCTNFDPQDLGFKDECNSASFRQKVNKNHCSDTLMEWAIGRREFHLPKHVGLELGGTASDRLEYVKVTWHYNNPAEKTGIIDNSGLRFFYTMQLRENTGMIMSVQQPSNHLYIPSGIDRSTVFAHCSSYCTDSFYPKTGVNIISIAFHMHLTGVAGKFRHVRNGTELEPIDENKVYDTSFQEFVLLKEERNILPGDDLILECNFDTSDRIKPTVGGPSAHDEMCIAWMIVYPKNRLGNCMSYPTNEAWKSFFSEAASHGYTDVNNNRWSSSYYNTSTEKAVQIYREFLNQPHRIANCGALNNRGNHKKEIVTPESNNGFIPWRAKNVSHNCGEEYGHMKSINHMMDRNNKLKFVNSIDNNLIKFGIVVVIIIGISICSQFINCKKGKDNKHEKTTVRLRFDSMNDTECELFLSATSHTL